MTLLMRHMNILQDYQWKPDNKGSYLAGLQEKNSKENFIGQ